MKDLTLERLLTRHAPHSLKHVPSFARPWLLATGERLLHLREIRAFLAEHSETRSAELLDELFNKGGRTIVLKVGDPIPASAFTGTALEAGALTKLLQKHTRRVAKGKAGLYSASLFEYGPGFESLLPMGAELGRSFVQQRYWNSRTLDQLWQGIGAFLLARPDIRYLFGCVSISGAYPEPAKELLVHFFRTWFGEEGGGARARNPFILSAVRERDLRTLLPGEHYREELRRLKEALKALPQRVMVYGLGERSPTANLTFRRVSSDGFLEDLAGCEALISTAGNQLVGEALYLEKPVLAVPEPGNYEQCINAHFLKASGAGDWASIKGLTPSFIRGFMDRLGLYRAAIHPEAVNGTPAALRTLQPFLS